MRRGCQGPLSSLVAYRGAVASEWKGLAELRGCAFPGRGVLGCRPDGRWVSGVCRAEVALGAGQASALPPGKSVGGPGDLMETKVEIKLSGESGGLKPLGRLEGCFAERLGVSSGFTLGSFSLSSSLYLCFPGVVPSRHSGCYG